MPLYEYECADCRTHFEVRQRVVDDPITVCPSCGGSTKRVLHPVGIIFKGSGWYVTDSRKSDTSSTSSTETSSDKSSTDSKKDTTSSASGSPSTENKSTAGSTT
jgi:putative FmdB family regulatory protein